MGRAPVERKKFEEGNGRGGGMQCCGKEEARSKEQEARSQKPEAGRGSKKQGARSKGQEARGKKQGARGKGLGARRSWWKEKHPPVGEGVF
jgi:hypothetical protein